ncbi:MAG: hemerythrin family protein [Bacteroidales bacterium]|nr:hemerythrin family protein [Bacteroidales bacterium]
MSEKLIEWQENFSVNDEKIDFQHQKLINLINKFYDAFSNASAVNILSDILNEMLDYAKYHFTEEEKIFKSKNITLSDKHKEEHNFFISKTEKFIDKFQENDVTLSIEVMNFLRLWLYDHILIKDKSIAIKSNK